MRSANAVASLALLWAAPSFAATPFQDCQKEATEMHVKGMATTDLSLIKAAIEKQAECRKLATEADAEAIKFQDDMIQLHKQMVSEGHNIAF